MISQNPCPSALPDFSGFFGVFAKIILFVVLLLSALPVFAFSLGEAHNLSRLGERLQVEIGIRLAPGERSLEAGCIHLSQPQSEDDLPWLRQGSISLREGSTPAIVIASHTKVLDPALRIGLTIGCGYGIQRDYTLLIASPSNGLGVTAPSAQMSKPPAPETAASRAPSRTKPHEPNARENTKPSPRGKTLDRLVLSSPGNSDSVEPRLRLAPDLASWNPENAGKERERELLRMEYRLLQSLYEQTLKQLDTTENLRQMESSIDALQQQMQPSSNLSEPATPAATSAAPPTPTEPAAGPGPAALSQPPAPAREPSGSGLKTLIFVLGILLVIGAWVVSKHYRGRSRSQERLCPEAPEPVIDPRRFDEIEDSEEAVKPVPSPFNCRKPAEEATAPPPPPVPAAADDLSLSQTSIASATIDEPFEANPVMELAEIMLSFGRVKGAAQALQEFVDSNPEESLQPWIRLMDVYRMAGMRSEFERVAAELNQHFNVEIQLWDEMEGPATETDEVPAIEPLPIEWPQSTRKATSIEELEHIAQRVTELWPRQECSEFLDQLLRNNRGGLRTGFSRAVVEEILFLIDVQALIAQDEASAKENA